MNCSHKDSVSSDNFLFWVRTLEKLDVFLFDVSEYALYLLHAYRRVDVEVFDLSISCILYDFVCFF